MVLWLLETSFKVTDAKLLNFGQLKRTQKNFLEKWRKVLNLNKNWLLCRFHKNKARKLF